MQGTVEATVESIRTLIIFTRVAGVGSLKLQEAWTNSFHMPSRCSTKTMLGRQMKASR